MPSMDFPNYRPAWWACLGVAGQLVGYGGRVGLRGHWCGRRSGQVPSRRIQCPGYARPAGSANAETELPSWLTVVITRRPAAGTSTSTAE